MSARRTKRRRARAPRIPARFFGRFCIGCGCCDTIACGGGCGWKALHRSAPVGVCTECPAYVALLEDLDVYTARAIYREKAAKAEEWT